MTSVPVSRKESGVFYHCLVGRKGFHRPGMDLKDYMKEE
jgi:hypothetical protein